MDINTIAEFRRPGSREEAVLRPGEIYLAGGTWLYSEPQPEVTGFVDVTALGWPIADRRGRRPAHRRDLHDRGTRRLPAAAAAGRPSALFFQCATALLASHKVWNAATVGGNVCQSFCGGCDGLARRDARRRPPRSGADGRRAPPERLSPADDRQRHEQPAPAAICCAPSPPGIRAARPHRLSQDRARGARPIRCRRHRPRRTTDGAATFVVTAATRGADGAPVRGDPGCRGHRRRVRRRALRKRRLVHRPARRGATGGEGSRRCSSSRCARSWPARGSERRCRRMRFDAERRADRSRAAARVSACARSCASTAATTSRRAATPATAARARCSWTGRPCTPASIPRRAPDGRRVTTASGLAPEDAAASRAGVVRRALRLPVRVLHARDDGQRLGAAPSRTCPIWTG